MLALHDMTVTITADDGKGTPDSVFTETLTISVLVPTVLTADEGDDGHGERDDVFGLDDGFRRHTISLRSVQGATLTVNGNPVSGGVSVC